MGKLYCRITALLLALATLPVIGLACDGSGYVINSLTDNNDGTYTINMTIHIAGVNHPGGIIGGTQGFYFTTATPILSVTPLSLTSLNGTTLTGAISGNTVTWGIPGSGPYFVNSSEPTQTFVVTVVVDGFPSNWNGGGMENNQCPGGPGTSTPSPGYSGTFCLPPTISVAPATINACFGDQVTLSAIPSPGSTVSWSNGMSGSTITFTANNSGPVTATASSSCGAASETVTVNVTPLPTVSPLPDLDICEGELVNLNVQTQNATSIEWSNGFTGTPIVFSPTSSGVLTVTASSQCGSATESLNINVTPLPLLFVIQGDQSICEGEVATLEVQYENADNFFWNNGPTLSTIMVSPSQTQIFTATASNRCQTLEEDIIVDVRPLPDLDVIQGDQSVCIGESVTLEVFSIFSQDIVWSNGASGSTNTFTPSQTDTYTVTASNSCGTIDEQVTVEVSEGPALEVIEGSQAICQGESATLTISAESADAIQWSNGSTDTTITVSPGQSESYTVSLTNTCGTTDTTFDVDILEPPVIDVLQGSQEICIGDSAVLQVNAPLASSLQWSTGLMDSTSLTVMPGQTESYNLVAANNCGQADTSFTIAVNPLPEVAVIDGDQTICEGQSATLSVEATNEDNLSWSNGETDSLITVSPTQTETFTATVSNSCGEESEDITVTVNPVYDTNLELEACAGTTVTYNNTTLQPGDSQSFMLATAEGCDSIINVSVIELPVFESTLQLEACTGSTVVYENTTLNPGDSQSFTLAAQNGCDSVVHVEVMELFPVEETLELQTCPNSTIQYNGTELAPGDSQDFLFTGQNGCDSTVHVTVSELAVFESSLELEACTGNTATYDGTTLDPGEQQDFTLTASNGCDSVVHVTVLELEVFESDLQLEACTGSTALFDGMALAPGATQSFTYTAANGCDSTINVTVLELEVFESTLELEACTGATADYNGTALDPGAMQSFTFSAVNGCDSVVHVSVLELPVYESELQFEACSGTVITYDGTDLPAGSSQRFTYTTINGCDSIVDVTVMELPVFESALELEACSGSSATYNGTELSAGSSQDFTLTAVNGCDSVVHVSVLELPVFESSLQLEACTGSTVVYENTTLNPGDSQSFTLVAQNGCDSVVHVAVEELMIFESSLELEACTGTTATYDGEALDPGDQQDFILTAANGCDSVVHVTVLELEVYESDLQLEACTGGAALFDGTALAPGASRSFTYTAANGCDSTINVTVQELEVFESSLELEACAGSTASYNGVELDPGAEQDFTLMAANGCDSVVHVTVLELEVFESDLQLEACPGASVPYNGEALPAGDSRSFTLTAANGCDSVVHVSVLELPTYAGEVTLEACTGTTALFDGEELQPGAFQTFTYTAGNGCDSLINVSVLELPTYEQDLQLQACTGNTVDYNGMALPPGFTDTFTFSTQDGCDSIVHVMVEEVDILEESLEFFTCPQTTVTYQGVSLAPGEVQQFQFISQNGCDSIVTASVFALPTFETELELEACTGTTVSYNGATLSPGDSQPFTFTAANGCDSTVYVSVAELPVFESELQLQACPGEEVSYNGVALPAGADQDFVLSARNGCDSTVHVTVLELPTYEQDLLLQACVGTTLAYNGTTLAPGDSQSFLLASRYGCDSVVHVRVEGVEIFETELQLQACSGNSVDYNGTSLLAGEQQDFTFTSQIGCDSIVTVSVLELPVYEESLLLQTCEGTTITYSGVTLAPGDTHDFLFASVDGCDSLVFVSVAGVENIQTSESRTICEGDSSLIFGAYQRQPGPYSAVFTSANGCDSTHTVMLATSPLPQPQAEVQASCPDKDNGTIGIQTSGGSVPYTYIWNDGAFTAEREELPPGEYQVTATDARGCRQPLLVTVPERSVEVEIEARDITCFGRKDGLISLQGDGDGLVYQLNNGPLQSFGFFSSLEAGRYVARVEDSYGCRYELGELLIEEQEQLQVLLPQDTTIQLGKTLLIPALVNRTDSLSFSWNPTENLDCGDCPTPEASPEYSTRYRVAVRDAGGCLAEDDILILVNRKRNVYIPSAFSPNEDGRNDTFLVFGDETVVEIRSLIVYNRWGEPVYEVYGAPPNDPAFGWDGAFRGQVMNPAVFAYVAEVEFSDGDVELFYGDVTLAR